MNRLVRVCALVVVAAGSAPVFALGTPTAATAIYQQRGADGGIVHTDRPSPPAVVERAWRVDPEDPALARQRAFDLQSQAEAVTERIRRRLAEQQRRADDDAVRQRYARAELDRRRAIDLARENAVFDTVVIYPPLRPRPAPRWRFRESATPGSR